MLTQQILAHPNNSNIQVLFCSTFRRLYYSPSLCHPFLISIFPSHSCWSLLPTYDSSACFWHFPKLPCPFSVSCFLTQGLFPVWRWSKAQSPLPSLCNCFLCLEKLWLAYLSKVGSNKYKIVFIDRFYPLTPISCIVF